MGYIAIKEKEENQSLKWKSLLENEPMNCKLIFEDLEGNRFRNNIKKILKYIYISKNQRNFKRIKTSHGCFKEN